MDLGVLLHLELLVGLVDLYYLAALAPQERLADLEAQLNLLGQGDTRNPYSNIPKFVLGLQVEMRISLC